MPERLDITVARRLHTSREEARRVIVSGHVTLAGAVVTKPGMKISGDADIVVAGGRRPFVSRGGEKLEAAMAFFNIQVDGKICLDVGASTGGFTDCLLKRGAARVYAVENGVGQLADQLRSDLRVTLFEQTDIREISPGLFNEPLLFAAVDVSFISLTLVLPSVVKVLSPGAELVCLIKPQFEAGPGQVDKHGVIRDETVRQRAVAKVQECAKSLGFTAYGVIPSPVDSENKEYLVYFHL